MNRIDLRSDTMTRPTPEMRRAMADAEVGDEQVREDPTVNRLVARVCELLGTEDAMFLPAATMANQIAFCVHAQGGEELIGHWLSHPFNYEGGGAAVFARMMMRTIDGERGMYTPEAVAQALRPIDDHGQQTTGVLLVENTTNLGGGGVWPIDQVRAVTEVAHSAGARCHMDGARLMNAVVASATSAADYAACFDSVTLCFSKGLGAPVGAALAGSREFIDHAWRFKHAFGGALRQAGIIAAGALYGLDHHVDRLADDHASARRLAEGLDALPGLSVDVANVETNIIVGMVDADRMTGEAFVERMAKEGVDFFPLTPLGPQAVRFVTHIDVTAEMIEDALGRLHGVLGAQ